MKKFGIKIMTFLLGVGLQLLFGVTWGYATTVLFAFIFALLFEDLFAAIVDKIKPPAE